MINGLQHIAIGTSDLDASFRFYRDVLGFSIKLSDAAVSVPEWDLSRPRPVKPKRQTLRVIFAFHPLGGVALELVQFLSTKPKKPKTPVQWGDVGIIELGVEVHDLPEYYRQLQERGVSLLTPVQEQSGPSGETWKVAYLRDPDGALIQLLDRSAPGRPRASGRSRTLGIHHLGVGVADLSKAHEFYADVLKFDRQAHRWRGTMPRTKGVTPAALDVESLWLERSQPSHDKLGVFGKGLINLVQVKNRQGKHIFGGRRWGDIGAHEIALDTGDVDAMLRQVVKRDLKIYWPKSTFTLGPGSSAHFAQIKDPDGNAIELVEFSRLAYVLPKIPASWLLAPVALLDRFRQTNLSLRRLFASKARIE